MRYSIKKLHRVKILYKSKEIKNFPNSKLIIINLLFQWNTLFSKKEILKKKKTNSKLKIPLIHTRNLKILYHISIIEYLSLPPPLFPPKNTFFPTSFPPSNWPIIPTNNPAPRPFFSSHLYLNRARKQSKNTFHAHVCTRMCDGSKKR